MYMDKVLHQKSEVNNTQTKNYEHIQNIWLEPREMSNFINPFTCANQQKNTSHRIHVFIRLLGIHMHLSRVLPRSKSKSCACFSVPELSIFTCGKCCVVGTAGTCVFVYGDGIKCSACELSTIGGQSALNLRIF